jgi:hypothetical protein
MRDKRVSGKLLNIDFSLLDPEISPSRIFFYFSREYNLVVHFGENVLTRNKSITLRVDIILTDQIAGAYTRRNDELIWPFVTLSEKVTQSVLCVPPPAGDLRVGWGRRWVVLRVVKTDKNVHFWLKLTLFRERTERKSFGVSRPLHTRWHRPGRIPRIARPNRKHCSNKTFLLAQSKSIPHTTDQQTRANTAKWNTNHRPADQDTNTAKELCLKTINMR